MPSPQYTLKISACENLEQGVYQAIVFQDSLELEFFLDDKIIKRVNLAPDRASFYRTSEATKDKISLICSRLYIDEQQLNYQKEALATPKKLAYKTMMFFKMVVTMLIPIQWVIVYMHKNESKWHKIIPDSKVFQADPFLVFKDEKYYLFYEELKFADYHGYLRVAELDYENGQLINDQIILQLEHHLSYPNVFEEQGIYYMIPECADRQRVDLYECTSFPYEWKKKKTLLENIQAADTTPLKTDDGWYLFASEVIKGAACDDELSIYKSPDLFNTPFEKLYDQPVISDVKNARMAGHFMKKDNQIYRVSQNCGKRYGHQVNINKIIQIENGYKEELVKTIKPTQGALGFHTYNQAGNIIVGDMEIARFDLYSLKRYVGGNIKRFFEIILGK